MSLVMFEHIIAICPFVVLGSRLVIVPKFILASEIVQLAAFKVVLLNNNIIKKYFSNFL
jgi:hypothetical protein